MSITESIDSEFLSAHLSGESYREIGLRHGLSHEGARQVVLKDGRKFVNQLELDLMVAMKLERMGQQAEWPCMVVAYGDIDAWQLSNALFTRCVRELRERGLPVVPRTRPTPDGTVFMITVAEEAE